MGAEPFVQSQQRVRVFPNLNNGPLRFRGRGDSRRNGKEKPAPFPGRRKRCGTQPLSPHEGFATRRDARAFCVRGHVAREIPCVRNGEATRAAILRRVGLVVYA